MVLSFTKEMLDVSNGECMQMKWKCEKFIVTICHIQTHEQLHIKGKATNWTKLCDATAFFWVA